MPTGAQGTTLTLTATYQDGTGQAVVPVTPLVSIIDPLGATVVANAVPTLIGIGLGSYDFAIPLAAPLGSWTAHWTATIKGVPTEADEVFTVVAAGSITFGSGQAVGVCAPWATVADVCAPCNGDFDEALLEESLEFASDVLYNLTGRQWPGQCTDVVRPCGYGSRGGCGCQSSAVCGCRRLSELILPGYPVVAVTEVKIDGVVIDSARYRVDNQRSLVYLPESDSAERQGWPCCARLDLADTEEDTWSVTYRFGTLPPVGGVRAAASLGCQLALSCSPDDGGLCRLPKRVTTITRQGVSMAILDPLTLFADGLTGLTDVDLWVSSVMVGAKRRRGSVVVPGRPAGVRRVGT